MRFVIHPMLGKLAKWLRVMGYDAVYQPFYRPEEVEVYMQEGRTLLTRHQKSSDQYAEAFFIHSDHVSEQLQELKGAGLLLFDRSAWFSRCLVCNRMLEKADNEAAREHVPEHIFYENKKGFSFCPHCNRFFWHGSHREAMVNQLMAWGF